MTPIEAVLIPLRTRHVLGKRDMVRLKGNSKLVLIAAALLAAFPERVRAQVEPPGSADAHLLFLVSDFQASWQRAWREGEELRRMQIPYGEFVRRYPYLHCHLDYFDIREYQRWSWSWEFPGRLYAPIAGSRPSHSLCPTWLLAPFPSQAQDESAWLDAALQPSLRRNVAIKRDQLIAHLDSALVARPDDPWITGQLVRFLLDARAPDSATVVASKCGAEPWWCAALRGLTRAASGDILAADSAFSTMRRLMPDSMRCEWDNAWLLLPPEAQVDYRARPCAERLDLNERLWWLADPLFREPGNARRVAQEQRRLESVLRTATEQDERLAFSSARGGPVVVELLARYGWPSYRGWLGMASEREHNRYQREFVRAAPTPPYTTFEYSLDRFSTVPSWHAIQDPFRSGADSWRLGNVDSIGNLVGNWWPQEHFKPSRRLLQLPQPQIVAVRRQHHVEVVTALEFELPAWRAKPSSGGALLLASYSPERVDSLDQHGAHGDHIVRLRGQLSGEPVILAIEVLADLSVPFAARTRFGYTPPRPLASFEPEDIALSDVAVLSPQATGLIDAPSDSLLGWLSPTRSFKLNERRISLYWESYNVRQADSAQVTLRIVPSISASLLRRMGVAVGVLNDPSQGLEMGWRDHEAKGGMTTLAGPVPAQMRAITLDLTKLKPGQYTIEIRMRTRDGRETSQQTTLELQP